MSSGKTPRIETRFAKFLYTPLSIGFRIKLLQATFLEAGKKLEASENLSFRHFDSPF
jgi:hypothetical protein